MINHDRHIERLRAALNAVDGWQDDESDPRQRRFRRFAVRAEAKLCPGDPTSSSHAIRVHVRDISRGGMGVLSDEPAVPGTHWRIELADGSTSIASLNGFCRYCRPITDHAYLIGIEFGIEGGILMALGVSSIELAQSDRLEAAHETAEFVSPESLMDDAA